MSSPSPLQSPSDWELDYYSRPVHGGRWQETLGASDSASTPTFAAAMPIPLVKSVRAEQASIRSGSRKPCLSESPRRCTDVPHHLADFRAGRASMRNHGAKGAEAIGLRGCAHSRRCYALVECCAERELSQSPQKPGYYWPGSPAPVAGTSSASVQLLPEYRSG